MECPVKTIENEKLIIIYILKTTKFIKDMSPLNSESKLKKIII